MVAHGVAETVAAFTDMQRKLEAIDKSINGKALALAKQKSKEQIALYKKETAEVNSQGKIQLAHAKAQAKERTTIAINEAKAAAKATKSAEDAFERAERRKSQLAEREAAKRTAIAEREQRAYGRMVGNAAVRGARNAIGTAGQYASTAVTLGGGLILASSLKSQMAAEKVAAQISVQSNMPGDRSQFINTKDAMAKIRLGAKATHMDQDEYAVGINKIIAATGNTTRAFQIGQQAMTIAKAEGIDPEELGHALGNMMANNPELSNEEVIKNLQLLVGQGKLGMVEMKEMAAVLPRATSTAGKFEGNVAANKAFAAGLLQIGIRTTGDADAAATAVKLLPEDIMKNEAAFKKAGINVRGANGGIRNERAILQEAITKTGGDPFALRHMFGERAGAITAALADTYKTAEANQKGSGAKAVSDEFDRLEKATLSTEDVMKDFAITIDTAADKLETFWRDIKEQVGDAMLAKLKELIPEMAKLVPQVIDLLKSLIDLTSFLANHPFASIFTAIAGSVALEIAKAFAVARVQQAIGGGGAGGGVGAGAGGGLGGFAVGTAAVVAATAMYHAGKTTYADYTSADQIAEDVKSGKISPADAQKILNQAKQTSESTGWEDIIPQTARALGLGGFLSDEDNKRADEVKKAQAIEHGIDLQNLIDALNANTDAQKQRRAPTDPNGSLSENK